MLILSRRDGESITIADTKTNEKIVITVVGTRKGKVRIGIDGPKEMKIMRNELLLKTKK